MTRDVRTCRLDSNLNDAARGLWERDCGIVPVVNAEGVAVGVITDRDICMGAHLTGRALHELRVADSMSRQLFACASSDPIEQVIRVMGDQRVRRVPVLDGQGKPVGIVSLNDVVRRLVALTDDRTRSRLTVRLIEALASICETRTAQAVPEVMPPRADAPAPVLAG